MDDDTLQQLQGLNSLVNEAVGAGLNAIQETHEGIARVPFAVLAQFTPIAPAVKTVETIQSGLTGGVYDGIRQMSNLAYHTVRSTLVQWQKGD
ncbi:MAG: hypothetical protein MUE40_14000 [Anaerolineae bacterium]|nr:hypothetical protein [Anaerolineae bacterium]